MTMTREEIKTYLKVERKVQWFYLNSINVEKWNTFATPEEAFKDFCDTKFRIQQKAFDRTHSAMSAEAAVAYTNNWN